jgi:hypothetical protein
VPSGPQEKPPTDDGGCALHAPRQSGSSSAEFGLLTLLGGALVSRRRRIAAGL